MKQDYNILFINAGSLGISMTQIDIGLKVFLLLNIFLERKSKKPNHLNIKKQLKFSCFFYTLSLHIYNIKVTLNS